MAWRLGGWVSAWNDDTERALQRLVLAERLDPLLQADVPSARCVVLLVASDYQSILTAASASGQRGFLRQHNFLNVRHVECEAIDHVDVVTIAVRQRLHNEPEKDCLLPTLE